MLEFSILRWAGASQLSRFYNDTTHTGENPKLGTWISIIVYHSIFLIVHYSIKICAGIPYALYLLPSGHEESDVPTFWLEEATVTALNPNPQLPPHLGD